MPSPASAITQASVTTKLVAVFGLLCICQIIVQEVVAMRSARSISFISMLTAFAQHGLATTIDLGWYPPDMTDVNNLTNVLTAKGVYGFVYNNSYPTNVPYGTYVWCNMPHVRKEEYVKPSAEYTLKFVELVHRHHKRSVYASNAFPVESYGWDCNDEGLYYYGQPTTGNRSAHTFWQGYLSATNPFKPPGFQGSCQFPQITAGGLDDSWQHGKDLYGVYHDLLGFLPEDVTDSVSFRVTQNVITSQVAGMVLNGMYNTQNDVALLVEPSAYDSLEPTYTCNTANTIYNEIKTSSMWENHLSKASSLYSTLDDISGVSTTDSGFHASFDHYYDNLSARQCHAKPLPCKLINGINSTTCVSQDIADEVYRFGNWEYSYIYRDSPTSLNAAVGSMGVFIAELSSHVRNAIGGESSIIYHHNIAHDGSISRLLSFMQIDVMIWPGMGSEIVWEVYQKASNSTQSSSDTAKLNNYYMRVLFGGNVLKSSNPSLGVMDMVPLATVLAYFDGLVGINASLVVGKCNGTVPY